MAARVLIVDDAVVMRSVLKTILSKNGFDVCGEAGDGEEATKVYLKLRPDIVTMDILMPGMTGLEALRYIIASDPGAKVIMCSADSSREAVVGSLKAGAKDFVSKPFNVDRLLLAIKKAQG